jgi:hypothetical protein
MSHDLRQPTEGHHRRHTLAKVMLQVVSISQLDHSPAIYLP